jgi:hypothetical protein
MTCPAPYSQQLTAEGDGGFDLGGAAGGDVEGRERHDSQRNRDAGERHCVRSESLVWGLRF